jgi:hypothetical protein
MRRRWPLIGVWFGVTLTSIVYVRALIEVPVSAMGIVTRILVLCALLLIVSQIRMHERWIKSPAPDRRDLSQTELAQDPSMPGLYYGMGIVALYLATADLALFLAIVPARIGRHLGMAAFGIIMANVLLTTAQKQAAVMR